MASIARPGDSTFEAAWPALTGAPTVAVVGWLVAASVVELLVLRTFTRVAIHIPGLERMAGPYTVLSDAGRLAYYSAAMLAIAALGTLTFAAWRSGTGLGRLATIAIAAVVLPAALLRAGPHLGEAAPLNTIALIGIGLLALLAAWAPGWRAGVVVGAFGAATLLSGWYTVAQGWGNFGASAPASVELLRAAEYLAVGFAIASPLLFVRTVPRRAIIAGMAVAALTLVIFMGNPATTRMLLLWSHGLTGALPAIAYAAAAGCFATTVLALVAAGRPLSAFGLVLLLVGGVGIQNTYQTALVATGLLSIMLDAIDAARATEGAAAPVARGPHLQGEPVVAVAWRPRPEPSNLDAARD